MNFAINRPQGFAGAGDQCLPDVVARLTDFLIELQDDYRWEDELFLSEKRLQTLALILVEFFEDLRNDIGLWRSLEGYQQELFGTPLPLIVPPGKQWRGRDLIEARVRFLISVLFPFMGGRLIGPDDFDLPDMSRPVTDFLLKAFVDVPRGSGIKQYLSQPVRHGWDVSDRLVWLGQSSYLFRLIFADKVPHNAAGEVETAAARNFLYSATTAWAGLGVIDILAATLDITEPQRADVRSWYERHLACYLVETASKGELLLKNLFNEAYYRIPLQETDSLIEAGTLVRGALVPWAGVWYWVAEPEIYRQPTRDDFEEVKTALIIEQPELIYLYDPDRLKQDQALVEAHYEAFVDCFFDDCREFEEGTSMAQELIEYRARVGQPTEYDKLTYGFMSTAQKGGASVETLPNHFTKIWYLQLEKLTTGGNGHGKVDERTDLLTYSKKYQGSIGVYFNRAEGLEVLTGYREIEEGLGTMGCLDTDEEANAVRRLVEAEHISPQFIERLTEEVTDWALPAAYGFGDHDHPLAVPFLLRQHKGHFYRKRYPNLKSL